MSGIAEEVKEVSVEVANQEGEDIEERKTTRHLKYVYTGKDRLEMGDQLADALRNLQSTQDELGSIQAQYKSAMKRLQGEIANIAEKVRSGWEMRSIECKEVLNFRTGNAEILRIDTGERVVERPLSASERQMKLDLMKEKEEDGKTMRAGTPPAADLAAVNSQAVS